MRNRQIRDAFLKRTKHRVCVLLVLLLAIPITTHGSPRKDNVSIQRTNTTISSVIKQIESTTEYTFFYTENLVDLNHNVSISKKDLPLEQLLVETFEESGYSWAISGKQISISPKSGKVTGSSPQTSSTKTTQQEKKKVTVSGIVIEKSGEAIIGASIMEQGTSNGTMTDIDGNFALEITEGNKLHVSYLGFHAKEISTVGKSSMEIVLDENSTQLEEVVVVGYGIQKKINMTGSVAAIDGQELAKRPVVNVTQSLQGVIPGLNVTAGSGSGKPGASMDLNIRGKGNLSGGDSPYILVDGLEMGLADVNPNDIESISVLKDAAASAIYGARAAFGVILITTKKGKEGKINISYNGNVGWSSPLKLPDMVNSYEFAKFFNAATYNAIGTKQYSDEKLAQLEQYVKDPRGMNSWAEISSNGYEDFENSPKGLGNTDYFALHYKNTAVKQNHNISVTGGSEKIQYYISGGLYNEDGILRYADMNYRRLNLNSNLTSDITKWMKVKLGTKYARSKDKSPFGDGAINEGMFFHNLARFRPTVSPYDLHGNFTELSQIPYLRSGTATLSENSNISILTGIELQPIKNWRIFVDYNYKKGTTDYEATAVPAQIVGVNGETYLGVRSELNIPRQGSYTRSNGITSYNSINAYTNYMLTVAQKHNFVGLLGIQQESNRYSLLKAVAKDLLSTTTPGIELASGDKIPTESRQHWATRGAFGRINYDYDSRYLFEANVRYDGSSRFHKDNRWGWFPSVSAGWNIANEEFLKPINNVLSILKLRGSYGLLGNQSGAGLYTYAQLMGVSSQGSWYFQDGRDVVINAPGAINAGATWEKIRSTNIGLDFSLWNNKISGSFDVYQRNTRDMLGPSADYADMFGTTAPNANNANMKNQGWELTLTYRGSIGKDINYSLGGMLSDYRSEVTEYQNPSNTDPAGKWYIGKRVGEIWGYRSNGLIQTQAEADAYNDKYDTSYLTGQKWQPGDVKYCDLNGDDKINKGTDRLGDMGDLEVIGNSTPRYMYSLNGYIGWKGISLSMLWQGVGQRDYNPAGSAYFWGSSSFAQVTVFKEHLDYWRGSDDSNPNPDAYYPRPYSASAGAIGQYTAKTSQTTDRYLQNGAYIRLKNLTISYDLPTAWTRRIGLTKANIYFSGENMLTFTSMKKMFDPESAFAFGEGGKSYPLNKVYSIGMSINL